MWTWNQRNCGTLYTGVPEVQRGKENSQEESRGGKNEGEIVVGRSKPNLYLDPTKPGFVEGKGLFYMATQSVNFEICQTL